jgi:hypothetical protein
VFLVPAGLIVSGLALRSSDRFLHIEMGLFAGTLVTAATASARLIDQPAGGVLSTGLGTFFDQIEHEPLEI